MAEIIEFICKDCLNNKVRKTSKVSNYRHKTFLGDFLKLKRRELKLTQKTVAKSCGLTDPVSVGMWELGKSIPVPHHVSSLASLMRIPLKQLEDLQQLDLLFNSKREYQI